VTAPHLSGIAAPENAARKIAAISADIQDAAARPLFGAVTLPPAAYTDEAYFAFEAKRVLEAGWLCVAHVSELKEPGSFLAINLLGEPLVITREANNAVHVLSRVCPHRSMDIMPEGFDVPRSGTTKNLTCPYHLWAFNLDGSLKGCPLMERAQDFKEDGSQLARYRSEVWKGFVFVNFDGNAAPVAEQYADLAKALAPWKTEEMEVVIALDWECEFNWKVMIENWMESYHHIGAHSKTLNPTMPGQNTWTEPEHPHYVHAHLPFKKRIKEEIEEKLKNSEPLPGFRAIPGLAPENYAEWGLYLGYPCFMILTTHDRVLWYRLSPVSAGHCKLQTMTLVSKESLNAPDYAETLAAETKMLTDFHQEDMFVNTAVQRGLRSRKAVRGRLSHLEEPIWLIHRYIAARLNGTYAQRADRAPYSGPLAAAE
jgi:phenylpropionate dioxygenase-like ring-hydroxylating dioxygenase large terminal subunit